MTTDELIAGLRHLHRGSVLGVHPGTHHSRGLRRLFSACTCGWKSGPVNVPAEWDEREPMKCPTMMLVETFEAQGKDGSQ